MVATRKKNGDVRIYLDPRDLNKALKRPHYLMRTADDEAFRLGNAKVFSTLDAKAGFWQIKLEKQSSLRTTFSTPYWEVQVSLHALWHQHSIRSVPASNGKDLLKDIHAQSLSTTSSSEVLLKKNMMPTSGKSWRELDRLA